MPINDFIATWHTSINSDTGPSGHDRNKLGTYTYIYLQVWFQSTNGRMCCTHKYRVYGMYDRII